jgi:hypothetical protein
MLPEAALFLEAERVLIEVLGRVRPTDEELLVPPVREGDRELSLRQVAVQVAEDDRQLARELGSVAGHGTAAWDGLSAEQASAAARDAARSAPQAARTQLLQAAVARALTAHYVATAGLGSTACPLPEELARPLWALTEPDAEAWRASGWFRAPLPLPPHVSWRDRFLRTAGHDPHPAH